MNTPQRAALQAVGIHLPAETRTNDWWEARFPEQVRQQRESVLAKLWSVEDPSALNAWDRAMLPHVGDPFRGVVARRVMGPGDSSLGLARQACAAAMEAARLGPDDIDYALVASIRPDKLFVGEAAQLARLLGLRCPAVFFESACNAPLVGLQLAEGLLRSGAARRVLVSATSTYTRDTDPADSFSWFLGDGAGAFVVGLAQDADEGILGQLTVPTLQTCDVFEYAPKEGGYRFRNIDRRGGRLIRDHAEGWLRSTVDGALARAGLALGDVDLFVVNTPVAWYADFVALALGIDRERVVDTHTRCANIGPALLPLNLHTAASQGRLRRGDVVLAHSIGSESTAGALVMRWGEVAVGGVA